VALGNTPRRETNIAVEASKSYVLGMRFITTDADRSPVDLTDCILRFVATEPPQRGSTEVLTILAEFDQPTSGLAQFKFQAADLTLEPGSYAYDVTLVPPSGYSTPILKGYLEIGSNTDLDDTNVFGQLNVTSDITVIMDEHDSITIEIERVDGMFLVVSALIEDFRAEMQGQVNAAAGSAQDALTYANEAEGYKNEMQAWLDNAGYPFWKGTQAEFAVIQQKREILYLITDEAVAP
jgi:hypothetical protein